MVLPEAHIGIYDGWALRRLCDTRNLSSTGDDGLIVRESLKELQGHSSEGLYIFYGPLGGGMSQKNQGLLPSKPK